MARRITGALVNKGDLVVSRQLHFSFNSTFPWIGSGYCDLDGYNEYTVNSGLGIVLKTLPKYDRSINGNDCSVFWTDSRKVTKESSKRLQVLSKCEHRLS